MKKSTEARRQQDRRLFVVRLIALLGFYMKFKLFRPYFKNIARPLTIQNRKNIGIWAHVCGPIYRNLTEEEDLKRFFDKVAKQAINRKTFFESFSNFFNFKLFNAFYVSIMNFFGKNNPK